MTPLYIAILRKASIAVHRRASKYWPLRPTGLYERRRHIPKPHSHNTLVFPQIPNAGAVFRAFQDCQSSGQRSRGWSVRQVLRYCVKGRSLRGESVRFFVGTALFLDKSHKAVSCSTSALGERSPRGHRGQN